MRHVRSRLVPVVVIAMMMALVSTLAYAQGAATTAPLSGQVQDSSGGVIPGADILAKNAGTGAESRTVSDATGKFSIPALPPGRYVVTVSLMGFKTVSLPDIQLSAGQPAQIRTVVLEVGKLEETVVVTGATEIVQTQTAAVTTTLSTTQINHAPLPTRNTLDFVAMLPGVNTTGTIRNSTVMGLAGNATNITIDGINTQDNFLKATDGFFSRISPRMDAVEEVTVSSANPGAESAGQGAVQIRFQTRQGTNKFTGSLYWYNRNTAYNSNYWFNVRDGLPKDKANINTAGFRVGGPVVIPKLFDGHDRLFFFFNYEDWEPGTGTTPRSRSVMTNDTANGLLFYGKKNVAGADPRGQYSVNIWDVVTSVNQQMANTPGWVPLSTSADPAMGKIISAIQASRANGTLQDGTLAGFNTLAWSAPSAQYRKYPTLRMDANITPRNRVGFSYYFQKYYSQPDSLNTYDPYYPGFPNALGQNSNRWSWVANYRSTITSNMVNEVRGGMTGGPVLFADGNGTQFFDDPQIPMNGWAVSLGLITSPYRSTSFNSRDAPTRFVEDTLSWIKGKHSINMGATYTQVLLNWPYNYFANTLGLGMGTGDEANGLFATSKPTLLGTTLSAATMPSATSTELGYATNLYAMLTGRVSSVTYTAYLGPDGQYHVPPGANTVQKAHQNELGTYIQDSWRLRPNLTLTYGLRFELQRPFSADSPYYWQLKNANMIYSTSGVQSNPANGNFTPGVVDPSNAPVFIPLTGAAYNQDWGNFAPSIGFAWKPQVNSSLLKTILSQDPVFRGGFSRAYLRNGMAQFTNEYMYNPGGSFSVSRSNALQNYTPGTAFFSQPSTIPGPAPFDATLPATKTPGYSDDVLTFMPNTKTPYTNSWNVGFQRTLDKNTALELRYVGNRANNQWYGGNGRNLNGEADILNNPGGAFVNEFKNAQANLMANIAAGRGQNFKYYGPGTSTVPLPVFMSYFLSVAPGTGAANDASKYTGTLWASTTFTQNMGLQNPNAISVASSLQANYRSNAITAGLPANFFYMSPGNAGAGNWVIGRDQDYRQSSYDAIQVELRRRMAGGLLVQGSYQYVVENKSSSFFSIYQPGEIVASGPPLHTFKLNWVYELPFGQGKRWGSGVSGGWNRLIGGWSFDGTGRLQTGNQLDFGNVRLVGMTDADLQNMFFLRFVNDPQGKTRLYFLPQDVIDNTILAYSNSYTNTTGFSGDAPTGRYIARNNGVACIPTYSGDTCGSSSRHHFVNGPAFARFDMALRKRINVTARVYMEVGAEAMNIFDNINFFGTAGVGSALTNFEAGTAYRDSSGTNDPGGRLLQFSWRISW